MIVRHKIIRGSAYRPEIDGLRAIAIALTCLFHFQIAGAEGGFLGIPIFFVISGYLVGGIVVRSMSNNQFQLATFWRRRLARIVPALLAVSATVLFAGYFLLLPDDYVRTAATIRASLLIHANHQLFGIQDYFGPTKYEVHFLHSWSLSLEEQFYVTFPVFAWVLVKFPRWTISLLCGSVIFGFALYVWGRYNHPFATHYFLVTRAWELLVGVLVFVLANSRPRLAPQRTLLPWSGLIMTVGPAFLPQGDNTLFNITMHLSVVLGTAIILFFTDTKRFNPITWLLASAPMRGLGLISYSLYLIHWPLLTLAMYYWIEPIPTFGRISLLAASILLAWASWRWIENPLRSLGNAETTSNHQVFLTSALSVAAVLLAVHLVLQFQGFPGRVSEQTKLAATGALDFSPLRTQCHSHEVTNPVPPEASCLLGKGGLTSTVAVWGDSHGVELAFALAETDRFQVRQLTSSSCPPLLSFAMASQIGCTSRNISVLKFLLNHPEIHTVVLAQHFLGYEEISHQDWIMGLDRTVSALREMDRTVIIMGPVPFPRRNVPSSLARSVMFGGNETAVAVPRSTYYLEVSPIISELSRLAKAHGAKFVDVTSIMCNKSQCSFATDGRPLYFDDNHLSLSGARIVAGHMLSYTAHR